MGLDVGKSETFALDIDKDTINEIEAADKTIKAGVTGTLINEDEVNLEALAKQGDKEGDKLDKDLEDSIATQIALEEALKSGEIKEEDLVFKK